MSYNIKNIDFYNWLINIKNLNFSGKSVLLIGTGIISEQYAMALTKLGVKNVTVVTNTEQSLENFCAKFNYQGFSGGYEKNLAKIDCCDLVIVATPITKLLPCTTYAISKGQKNFLVEKPGTLYKSEFENFIKLENNIQIKIGYNRLVYPNFIKLKSILDTEKISSCIFTITERSKQISSLDKDPEVLNRWGISNTLHVLSMVVNLIGFPDKITSYANGTLPWHSSGSKFVGGGISEKNIPFSFHGDWESQGGWSIEIITNKNRYRLNPLETISYLNQDGHWEKIDFDLSFPNLKFGLAEEIAIMLTENQIYSERLVSIDYAIELNSLAEKIFHYS